MTSLRVVCLLLVIAAGVSAGYDPKKGRHNITMGQRRHFFPYDLLLYHDNPKVSGSSLPYPKVISHDVCYPPKGSHAPRSTITAFKITDLVPGDDGGYVFITSGGVDSSAMCLHLKTQRGKGYNFDISIWGFYV